MALRSRRFGRGDPEVMVDINTTPLIDVMLVLLVMLIITVPIQLHAVNLRLPVGTAPHETAPPQKIRVDIDGKNVVTWQGQPVTAGQLEMDMAQAAAMNPQPEIDIRPDKGCSYAVFANVLSSSRRAGLGRVAVIGHEQFMR